MAGYEIDEVGRTVAEHVTVAGRVLGCCSFLAAAVDARPFIVASAPDKINSLFLSQREASCQ